MQVAIFQTLHILFIYRNMKKQFSGLYTPPPPHGYESFSIFFFFPWAGREILRSVILFDCLSFIVITKYGDNTYNSYDIVTLCLVFVCFRPYKAFDVIYIKKNILNFWNNVLKIVILKKSKFSIRQKDNLFLSGIFKWNLFLNQ